MRTKETLVVICSLVASLPFLVAKQEVVAPAGVDKIKQEVLDLSKQKWLWMADKNVAELDTLFHNESVFVHMGGSMTKEQELAVIKSGGIHYKNAEVQDASVRVIGGTAILLNRVRLTAVVGGNEVVNLFVVTEVYVIEQEKWKLCSLSFTRLLAQ